MPVGPSGQTHNECSLFIHQDICIFPCQKQTENTILAKDNMNKKAWRLQRNIHGHLNFSFNYMIIVTERSMSIMLFWTYCTDRGNKNISNDHLYHSCQSVVFGQSWLNFFCIDDTSHYYKKMIYKKILLLITRTDFFIVLFLLFDTITSIIIK